MGIVLLVSPRLEALGLSRSHAPLVGNGPGAIALRRIPFGPHSVASDFVMMLSPAFDMAEGTVMGPPFQIQVVRIEITLALSPASSQRLPQASGTENEPRNTISAMALKPRGERSLVRLMKLPAALL